MRGRSAYLLPATHGTKHPCHDAPTDRPDTDATPRMSDRLFPLSMFSTAIPIVTGMGFDFDSLADMANIPHGLLGDPNAMITARQYHELASLGRRLLHDPAFSLNVTEWLRLEMFELLGPLFATTPTVRSYLQDCVRFMPLIDPCVDGRLEEEGDDARYFCFIVPDQGVDDRFFHAEANFAGGFRLLRAVFQRAEVTPQRIEMQHDGSAWLDTYRKHFGEHTEFVFNAPENVAIFSRQWLDLANPGHSPTVHAHMLKLALARLASLPSVDTTSTSVMRVLERETGQRILDLGDVAGMLGMTPRTLQRRLGEENTTFQKLRDGVRLQQAQAMLRDESLDIATIAATLGFSEPTTFHRAFKTWSGLSPAEFRRRQHGG